MDENIIIALNNAVVSLNSAWSMAHHEAVGCVPDSREFHKYSDTAKSAEALSLKVKLLAKWLQSQK